MANASLWTSLPAWSVSDRAFAGLALVPFLVGIPTGLLARPAARVIAAMTVLVGVVWLAREVASTLPDRGGVEVRLLATAFVWQACGFYVGTRVRRYGRAVGSRGLAFTVGQGTLGVYLAALVLEVPLLAAFGAVPRQPRDVLTGYGVMAALGAALLLSVGLGQLKAGLSVTLKAVASAFTVFGVLALALAVVTGNVMADVLWAVPDVPTPVQYQVLLPFVLGVALGTLPRYQPLEEVVPDRAGPVDPGEGLTISRSRVTAEAAASADGGDGALRPVRVTPWLPKDWRVLVDRHQPDQITVTLRTPGLPFTRGLLELSVTRSPLTEPDAHGQLRDLVRKFLLSRDALIVESGDAVRHGEPALTFLAKGDSEYVYLVCFLHRGNFFSIAWSAASAKTFRLGRYTVDEFIDRLDIKP
jgi:hypothetical protein